MRYKSYQQIELILDDVAEIINQVIVYMTNIQNINDSIELYYEVLSILERIETIKSILRREI